MSGSKIVLITGANKGIGFEIAKQFASEYKGYHILLGSRDVGHGMKAAESLQKEGLSVEALTIDVADDRSIEAAAQTVKSKFGRLDVLINNAGISLDSFTGQPPTRAIFEQTFAVNLFGAASTTEAFIPLLEKSAAARPVFVSSDLGSLTLRADPEGRHNPMSVPAYRRSKVNISSPYRPGTVEDGAKGAVRLATLGEDGETGTYSEKEGPLPW
ncbi:putative carbonyl reductase [Mycena rosella]|uniref:Carbonyl reductase n=1 Tax=Mycena rosella TaxID=1033263 RepID=A0AAD7GD99_MYCRO|nr:putative carbonyl reductase [Mycena rosella]